MSILNTFYILFKTNADDVKKGGKEAIKTVDATGKKLKEQEKTTKDLGTSFVDIIEGAAGALAGILAVGTAIAAVSSQVKSAHELQGAAFETGDTAQQIDAVDRAAAHFGASVESTQATLKNLNKQILDVGFNGAQASPWMMRLGLVTRDANGNLLQSVDLMRELNRKFSALPSKREAFNIGAMAGISNEQMQLLTMAPAEYDKLIAAKKKSGGITNEEIESMNRLGQSWDDFSDTLHVAVRNLVTSATPAMIKFLNLMTEVVNWLNGHKDAAIAIFTGMATAIGLALIPAVIGLTASLWSMAAAVVAATWPFLLIAAAIAAVVYAILKAPAAFDWAAEKMGFAADKVGEKWKAFYDTLPKWAQDSVDAQVALWKVLQTLLGSFFDWASDKTQNFFDAFDSNSFGDFFSSIGDHFKFIGDSIGWVIDQVKVFIDYLQKIPSKVLSFIGGDSVDASKTDTVGMMQKAQDSVSLAQSLPLAAQTSTSIANNRTSNKNVDVKMGDFVIQTDQKTGADIMSTASQSWADHLKHAIYHFTDSVDA